MMMMMMMMILCVVVFNEEEDEIDRSLFGILRTLILIARFYSIKMLIDYTPDGAQMELGTEPTTTRKMNGK